MSKQANLGYAVGVGHHGTSFVVDAEMVEEAQRHRLHARVVFNLKFKLENNYLDILCTFLTKIHFTTTLYSKTVLLKWGSAKPFEI